MRSTDSPFMMGDMRLVGDISGRLAVVALALFIVTPQMAWGNPMPRVPEFRAQRTAKRVKLAITGMDCKGCESGISGELLRTPGVIGATVSYERQEAVVDYDSAKITPAGIIAAIKGAGFGAKLKSGR